MAGELLQINDSGSRGDFRLLLDVRLRELDFLPVFLLLQLFQKLLQLLGVRIPVQPHVGNGEDPRLSLHFIDILFRHLNRRIGPLLCFLIAPSRHREKVARRRGGADKGDKKGTTDPRGFLLGGHEQGIM